MHAASVPRPAPSPTQEVKRSEEFWKREARMQRQAAASVQAEDTQRRIKFMQVRCGPAGVA